MSAGQDTKNDGPDPVEEAGETTAADSTPTPADTRPVGADTMVKVGEPAGGAGKGGKE